MSQVNGAELVIKKDDGQEIVVVQRLIRVLLLENELESLVAVLDLQRFSAIN